MYLSEVNQTRGFEGAVGGHEADVSHGEVVRSGGEALLDIVSNPAEDFLESGDLIGADLRGGSHQNRKLLKETSLAFLKKFKFYPSP